jgi:hypothetical protein
MFPIHQSVWHSSSFSASSNINDCWLPAGYTGWWRNYLSKTVRHVCIVFRLLSGMKCCWVCHKDQFLCHTFSFFSLSTYVVWAGIETVFSFLITSKFSWNEFPSRHFIRGWFNAVCKKPNIHKNRVMSLCRNTGCSVLIRDRVIVCHSHWENKRSGTVYWIHIAFCYNVDHIFIRKLCCSG